MAEVRKGVGVKVTVAEEMASGMVAEAMEKGVGVRATGVRGVEVKVVVTVAEAMEKGVGVKVVVTVAIAEEMAAMVAVAYWM